MKSTLAITAALIAALLLAGQASAASVSYTSAPFSQNGPGFSAAVTQFDPALGTLTGVTVQLNMTITPIVTVLDLAAPAAITFNAFTNSTGDNPLGGPSLTHGPATWTDPYNNSGSADYALLVTNQTVTSFLSSFKGTPVATTPLVSVVPLSSLGDYIGTGTYSVAYATSGTINAGNQELSGPNYMLATGGDHEFDGTATVTYDYTVPEPATMSLLGLGLVGLIARRRSK